MKRVRREQLGAAWLAACLLGVLSGVGCGALPPVKSLGPALASAARQVPVEVPLVRHGLMVARVEPFSVVRALDQGLLYVEVDPHLHRQRGAWMSTNGGPWTTAATLRRGDRVEIAYTRTSDGRPAVGTLNYRFFGPTTRGVVRLTETRGYLDGFPEQTRPLRVRPYEVAQAALDP